MPGVVVLPTGAWYDPAEPGVPGTLELHGNPNVLTLDKGSSRLAQAPAAHSCLVEVERFAGGAPPVAAFDPPRFSAAWAGGGVGGAAPRRRSARPACGGQGRISGRGRSAFPGPAEVGVAAKKRREPVRAGRAGVAAGLEPGGRVARPDGDG